jgi:hypothetical protein
LHYSRLLSDSYKRVNKLEAPLDSDGIRILPDYSLLIFSGVVYTIPTDLKRFEPRWQVRVQQVSLASLLSLLLDNQFHSGHLHPDGQRSVSSVMKFLMAATRLLSFAVMIVVYQSMLPVEDLM